MSSHKKLLEYSSYRRMVKGCLYIVGLWPSENPKMYYRLLPYAQLLLSTMTVVAIINFLGHHIKNINVVIKVVSLLTSTSLYILKLCSLTIYRKEILRIHRILHRFYMEIIDDERLVEFACKKVKLCHYLGGSMVATVYGSFFLLLVLLPLINIFIQEIQHHENIKYTLVYPTMYPWNTTSNGLPYRITYVLESLTAFSCCNVTSGADCLLLFWIFQVTTQLRAMSYRLNNIRKDDNYDKIIRQNIVQYGILMRLRDELQKIYGPIIMYNNSSGAALLCTLIFQLTKASSLTKIQIARFTVYAIGKTLQVYMYSWPGTLLTTEVNEDWVNQSACRTSVLMTLSQKPLTLKICHVSFMSVEMFAVLINTTVSYYLLLKTIAPEP
ncbi:uncharacterized protein LOC135161609 isoform X2 [Diachasmimorpha longicaudata]|uniref:uncharacterized protein LOC135161609 isoform X2 n=1 Tax=Diachasmimorpha longicaudata TaxID=58733 RepID=UPI0030B90965